MKRKVALLEKTQGNVSSKEIYVFKPRSWWNLHVEMYKWSNVRAGMTCLELILLSLEMILERMEEGRNICKITERIRK